MAETKCTVGIIGAGPAGLVIYKRLSLLPYITPVLFEAGPVIDSRLDKLDHSTIINGVGGAGLFSDRKFSILPAGMSQLNANIYELRKSYRTIIEELGHEDLLKLLDPLTHLLGDITRSSEEIDRKSKKWGVQQYKSVVLSNFEDALSLINALHPPLSDPNVFLNTKVSNVQLRQDGRYSLVWDTLASRGSTCVDHVVCSMGRFGAWQMRDFVPMKPMRLEIGVRVLMEHDSILESVLLGMCDGMVADPKLKFSLPLTIGGRVVDVEFRTFCVCVKPSPEQGYVVSYKDTVTGIVSWSGSSSFHELQQRNNSSGVVAGNNLGVMMRIKDTAVIHRYYTEVMECGNEPSGHLLMKMNNPEFHKYLPKDFCEPFSQGLRHALRTICKTDAILCEELRVFCPCIEGTGIYPNSDIHTGEVLNRPNMWVVGDLTGHTRGLLQAMVGGDMLAKTIVSKQLDTQLKACNVLQPYQSCFLPAFVYNKLVVNATHKEDYCHLRNKLSAVVEGYLQGLTKLDDNVDAVVCALAKHAVKGTGGVVGVVYELHHFFLDSAIYGATQQLHCVSQHALIHYMIMCNVFQEFRHLLARVAVTLSGVSDGQRVINTMLAHDFRSCFLSLRFRGQVREEYTDIPVMQSAYKIHLRNNDEEDLRIVATLSCLLDALFGHCIRECGLILQLARTKIETQEPGVVVKQGCVPMYLECHVKVVMAKVGNGDGGALDYDTKRALIQTLANIFEGDSAQMVGIFKYMSVSINLLKHPEHGQQFFLTFRSDTKQEMEFLRKNFATIMCAGMKKCLVFEPFHFKFIPDSEFVIYDNNRDLDGAWFPTKQNFVHPQYMENVRALIGCTT